MRISLFAACVAASAVLTTVGAVAQPSPQFSVDDLVNKLAPAAPSAAGSGVTNDGCDPGFERVDGECQQVKGGSLGFRLPGAIPQSPPTSQTSVSTSPP